MDELRVLARSDRLIKVAFSGGRDSSLVLAAATRVARAEGTPLPVPLTQVWPHLPALDESRWQELVISHLGLPDWQRIDMGDDAELLGDAGRAGLSHDGLVFPPTIHSKHRLWRAAAGTHLLTGEGGDQVFGPTRVRALHHWREALRAPIGGAPQLARSLAPTPLLGLPPLNRPAQRRGWLQPAFADDVLAAWRAHEATEPWSARRAIAWVADDRAIALGFAALAEHAGRYDVRLHHPLLSPGFVSALASDAGLIGWPDRTRAMTTVAEDLLPAAITTRRDKVEFSGTVWGPTTRSWLAGWDGRSGIDAALVDAEGLRREWGRPVPHPATMMLAQCAWLGQEMGVDLSDQLRPREAHRDDVRHAAL